MTSHFIYSTHCEYLKMVDRRENKTALGKPERKIARPRGTGFDGRSSFYLRR